MTRNTYFKTEMFTFSGAAMLPDGTEIEVDDADVTVPEGKVVMIVDEPPPAPRPEPR